ncbi:NTP transferase domain-containing protein, partial [bacterium]|nr:NTP transferase domain-containing protein [bacterium]NIN91846.1 NTP transferase domain-containing protein [bacterium]NIO17942.1 NTP transferase domain-containing protein [bacterium]NIO73097.1 NTP transferase domain-containing protein [bacterium]
MVVKAVIMAGGKGERFWPLSRDKFPKQLLSLTGKKSLLQETVERIKPLISTRDILVVTRRPLARAVERQLPQIPRKNIIYEPVGRNTAPCIGLAAKMIKEDGIMVVLPADHIITPRGKFLDTLKKAVSLARETENLITIGIKPTYPATGYGYIEAGKKVGQQVFRVKRFVEKPDKKKAERLLKIGRFFWNSGMFVWKKSVILDAMKKYMPSLYKGLQRISLKNISKLYPGLPNVSIDYGIMEKANNSLVIPADFSWEDLGSWESLDRFLLRDRKKNAITGRVLLMDTQNCTVVNKKGLLSTIGVSDLIIVSTEDVTLVFPKGKGQQVKRLVERLRKDPKLKKY